MLSILNLKESRDVIEFIRKFKNPNEYQLDYVGPDNNVLIKPYPQSLVDISNADIAKPFLNKIPVYPELSALIRSRVSQKQYFLPNDKHTILICITGVFEDKNKVKKIKKNDVFNKNIETSELTDRPMEPGFDVKTGAVLPNKLAHGIFKNTIDFLIRRAAQLNLPVPQRLDEVPPTIVNPGLYYCFSPFEFKNGLTLVFDRMDLKTGLDTISKYVKFNNSKWINISINVNAAYAGEMTSNINFLNSCYHKVQNNLPFYNPSVKKYSLENVLQYLLPDVSAVPSSELLNKITMSEYFEVDVNVIITKDDVNEHLIKLFGDTNVVNLVVNQKGLEVLFKPETDEMDYYKYVLSVVQREFFTTAIRSKFSIKILAIRPLPFYPEPLYQKTFQRFVNVRAGVFSIAGSKAIGKTTLIKVMGMDEKWVVDSDVFGRLAMLLYEKYEIKNPMEIAKYKTRASLDAAQLLIDRFEDLNKDAKTEGHIRSLFEYCIDYLLDTNDPILNGISRVDIVNLNVPQNTVNKISMYIAETARQLIDLRAWDAALDNYLNHLLETSKPPSYGPILLHFVHSSFDLYSTIGSNVALLLPVMSPLVHIFSRSKMTDIPYYENRILVVDILLYMVYKKDEQGVISGVPISRFISFMEFYIRSITEDPGLLTPKAAHKKFKTPFKDQFPE